MIVTLADPFLAQNAGRRYPLADDSRGLSNTSILEARISTSARPSSGPVTPVIRKIDATTSGGNPARRIRLELMSGESALDTLEFIVRNDIPTDGYSTVSAFSDKSFGEITVTASVLSESYEGPGVPMSKTTVVCRSFGVDSLQGKGAVDLPSEEILTGDIILDPGRNADPYIDGSRIRIDVFKGAGIGEKCQDIIPGQTCDKVLFTINGEKPGSDGEIRIVGEGGISIVPDPDNNAIIISIDSASAEKMAETCSAAC